MRKYAMLSLLAMVGTYAGFDNRKVHMNMPATFAYGVGMQDRPVELYIDRSDHPDWVVATQLRLLPEGGFWAPDYYYFYDSPTMVGAIDFRSWESASNGRNYTMEVAMLHEGTAEELDKYADWIERVVEEEKTVFGELPDYDFGRYTFLCSYNPWVFGDGMEHRNSTVCTAPAALAQSAGRLIGTISHEFFHCWNVERIRPQSLEPFDFDEANMSDALWFAEGFTSYYTDLILCRAGILDPERYIRGLAGRVGQVINGPGRHHRSPVEMSYNAPFVDAASSVDEQNFDNTFISYYTYGAVLGLALDLTLRADYGTSLDAFMRQVWLEHGKPEVPYQLPDLERILGEVSGDHNFARRFFRASVYGSELPDMAALFRKFGVRLRLEHPGKVDFPGRIEVTEEGGQILEPVLESSSLYAAGLNRGDVILEIGGQLLDSEEKRTALIKGMKIGQSLRVKYRQNGVVREGNFTLLQDPDLTIEPDEAADEAALKLRKAWLKE